MDGSVLQTSVIQLLQKVKHRKEGAKVFPTSAVDEILVTESNQALFMKP